MTTKQDTETKFVFNKHGNRQPCHCCGGFTDEFEVCAEEKIEEGDEGDKLRVCARCLKAGQDQIDVILRAHVAQLRRYAQEIEGLIGRLKVPSYADWQAETERQERAL
jgi:hypothetical protein